jgi:hypothetical protein
MALQRGCVLTRILKFISDKPLMATIVGTIIGGWVLTQLLAMKWTDVNGLVGTIGEWRRSPVTTTHSGIISLVAVSILFGLLGFAALLLRELQRMRKTPERPGTATLAAAPGASATSPVPGRSGRTAVSADFKPTKRQAAASAVLQQSFPTR